MAVSEQGGSKLVYHGLIKVDGACVFHIYIISYPILLDYIIHFLSNHILSFSMSWLILRHILSYHIWYSNSCSNCYIISYHFIFYSTVLGKIKLYIYTYNSKLNRIKLIVSYIRVNIIIGTYQPTSKPLVALIFPR